MDLRGVLVVEDATSGRSAHSGRILATEHVANRPIAHHVLDALKTAASLQADPFREQQVINGLNAGGYSNAIDALTGKTNQPAYVRYVAEEIARLRGIAVDEVAARTSENFFALFGIPRDAH